LERKIPQSSSSRRLIQSSHFYENADVEQSRHISLEILRTWSFLLHPRHKSRFRSARKAYEMLETPSYLKEYLEHLNPTYKDLRLSELGDVIDANLHVRSYDMQQHLNPSLRKYNATKRGVYAYGLFPTYQNRIYHLREYMDKKKPRGLIQLWKDNRDSLNYYTFWGVIIFGLTSVVLASLSLITGVVQTWASVKALQVASNSGPAASTSS